jgi:hypothetical protein
MYILLKIVAYRLMGVIKIGDAIAQILCYQLLHPFGKGTGVTDRGTLMDAGCKSYRIGTAFDQLTSPQNSFFTGATTAAAKANDLYFFGHSGKCACFFAHSFKIGRAGAIIFRLHTSDDA